MSKLYIAVDGDDVGHYLEYLMLKNDTNELTQFATKYKQTMEWFAQTVEQTFEASFIFEGGDNLLFFVDEKNFSIEKLEIFRSDFANRVGRTLSIGLGYNARESYFALKLCKVSGKNCICRYEELNNA
ncbi:MAG TPA: mCpol domain-containing protein [Leptolyngbyaceae cyanobacterium]